MKLLHGTYLKQFFAASLLMLAIPFVLNAQPDSKKQETIKVYFRQNSKTLDPNYMNNRQALEQLTDLLQPYVLDSARVQGRVHILSSASPEGSISTNDRLIEGRAKAIANWVSKHFQIEIGYEVEQMNIDWKTFTTLVEETPNVPQREKVLEILRTTPESEVYVRQAKLRSLNNGATYEWLFNRFYPKMRYAAVRTQVWYASEITFTTPNPMHEPAHEHVAVARFTKNVDDLVVPTVKCDADWITDIVPTANDITFRIKENPSEEPRTTTMNVEIYGKTYPLTVIQEGKTPEPVVEPVVEEPVIEEKPECTKPFYMSISNNALYDLALIPNIGVEFYLGKNWSIDANWHYAWWKTDKRHRYWRTYGGDVAFRKWFGQKAEEKPLTGHHAGLYGQMITYDFELGGRGYLAPKWSWAAGAEYGYSLPIARRWNLDFNIGIGYHWGKYYEYLPMDNCYVWQATKHRKYFGPTKLEVSFVWLIGCGNYNKDKGGKK